MHVSGARSDAQSVGDAVGQVVTLKVLKTVVGTLVVDVIVAEARVKTVAVAVPETGVEVLSLISECMMEARNTVLTW